MIKFKRVWGRNFGSFEEFDFPFTPGKHMVSGVNRSTNFAESNGSGKSYLFESPSWCIHKRTIREKNISRDGKGKTLVGIEFDKEDDTYEIIRTFNKKDSEKKNSVKVTCNGENVSPRNNENIEDVIDRIVGIPYDLFAIVVTVLQGLPINLSTMTSTVRKSVLESMMGLDNWGTFNKLFQHHRKVISEEYNEVMSRFSASEDKMIAKNSEVETFRAVTDKNEGNLKEELHEVKRQISEARNNLNSLENKREMCSEEEPGRLYNDLDILKSSCTTIEDNINALIDLIEEGICPTCGQNYPESMINEAREKLEAYDSKLPKMQSKVKALESLIRGITVMDNDIYVAKREMRIIQANMNSIISRMDEQIEDNTTDIIELKKELDDFVAEVNDLNEKLKNLEDRIEGVNYILSLLLPSSSFRTRILERYLGYVNNILEEVSLNILDGMVISMVVDKKANGIEIVVNDGDRGYKSLSGGEKRRVDIIIILSLQRFLLECTGVSTNLLVFDEIFDSLDNTGIKMILNCIDSIFDEGLCVYIITHKNDFRSSFESFVEIEKVDNISSIL
jgi:DNA repair exonuclease SbcCD ATPase subunit